MRLFVYLLCAVIAACGGAQADPTPTPPPTVGREAVDVTAPDWATLHGLYSGSRVSIGGYPQSAEFGSDSTGIVQGITGAVQIPSTFMQPNHSAGVAGYARTESFKNMAVGVNGFGGVMVDGGESEGGHFLATNCGAQSCAVGVNAANNYVVELDLNIMATPTGAPTGNAFGLIMFGASNTQPKGLFQAIHIDSPGVFQSAPVPWKEGLALIDGAAEVGIAVGKRSMAAVSDSQPILFRSSDGAERTSAIQARGNGDLVLAAASGTAVVTGWGLRIAQAQAPASSTAPCTTGQIQWDANYTYVCIEANRWRRTALQDF